MVRGLLVHPVIKGRVEIIRAVSVNELGETAFQTREYVVEWKGVS